MISSRDATTEHQKVLTLQHIDNDVEPTPHQRITTHDRRHP